MPTLQVTALYVYPVKALRGQPRDDAQVEPWGFESDRRFMVVDESGRFLSQREIPTMATIDAMRDGPWLTLRAADRAPLRCRCDGDAAEIAVKVWHDRVAARLVDSRADAWLGAVLGRRCRLVFMDDPAGARPVDAAYARPGDHVTFADGFPVLLTSATSLADLNGRLPAPIGMDRFRPNLVVAGAAAWAEDGWRGLRIGDVEFELSKPSARCIVTTTDQLSGLRDADFEPIRTLQRFRRDGAGQVLFGANLVPRRRGRIAVGDPVEPWT